MLNQIMKAAEARSANDVDDVDVNGSPWHYPARGVDLRGHRLICFMFDYDVSDDVSD